MPNSNEWIKVTVVSRAGKVTGKHKNWFYVENEGSDERSVDLGRLTWEKITNSETQNKNVEVVSKRMKSAKPKKLSYKNYISSTNTKKLMTMDKMLSQQNGL